MGLDNGIYIKKKGEEEKIKFSGKSFFWGDEVAYWRKCYGIRRIILNTLGGEINGEYKYPINRTQLKELIKELKKFNTKLIHGMPFEALKDNFGVSKEFWEKVKGNLVIAKDVLIWDNICNKEIEPIMEDKDFTIVASEMLPNTSFDENTFGNWMNEIKAKTGRKGKDIAIHR